MITPAESDYWLVFGIFVLLVRVAFGVLSGLFCFFAQDILFSMSFAYRKI